MIYYFCVITIFALFTILANTAYASAIKNSQAIEEVISGKIKEAKASWWGFDPVDSTEALQSAINSGASKVIIEDMGIPWIVDKIQLESNQELFFEEGAVVIAKKGSFKGKGDCLFNAISKNNIFLNGYGATLKMHKADYTGEGYEKAEWRHVLTICSCSNIRVYGLTLAESGGDGIYLGAAKAGVTNKDIHIKDVICDSNHRQGISVITARNLLIENCILKNTSGTPPAAGIDFEPNLPDEELVNCVMRNCITENNAGDGYEFYLRNLNGKSADIAIRLENCRSISDNTFVRYVINNGPKGVSVNGLTEFINCSFEKSKNAGIIIGDKPAKAGRVRFIKCILSNSAMNNPERPPIIFNARQSATEDIGGVDFVECIINESVVRTPINFEKPQNNLEITDVTGSLKIKRNGFQIIHHIVPESLKN